jgi:hypothetical protein
MASWQSDGDHTINLGNVPAGRVSLIGNGTLDDHAGALEAARLFPSNLTVQARSDVVHTEARVIDGAGGFGTGLVGR